MPFKQKIRTFYVWCYILHRMSSHVKLKGHVPVNWQNAENCSLRFSFLINFRLLAIWRKIEMVRWRWRGRWRRGRRWREGETEIAEGMEMER
jgi:hypothetical protein